MEIYSYNEMKLQGIFPPIATPFDHNGDIYAAKVQHNVEKWNRTALSGYVVMGSTGESVMLTADEKYTVWELVAKHAAPEKLLIAGTGMEERARDRGSHQSRRRNGLQGRHGAHAALLQEPASTAPTRRRSTSARWPTSRASR